MIVLGPNNSFRFYWQYYEFIIMKTNHGVKQIVLDIKVTKKRNISN